MVNVRKRGKTYEYCFDITRGSGKRKRVTKAGFQTKKEAIEAGEKAFNDYTTGKKSFDSRYMTVSEYFDYWYEKYCKINLKYHTLSTYEIIIRLYIKPKLGHYYLNQIDTNTIQNFINKIYVERTFSKAYIRNILKVVKAGFNYAVDIAELIPASPALKVKSPKYDVQEDDPAHIFTKEEVKMILERFKNNHAAYYAMLTAYYTGLRVSEVFGLTWDDIDFEKKTLTVNRNILKKNQAGGTKQRHISGNSTTVWYFGTCKTQSSYRTIDIGDTLVNALKEYKAEQEVNRKNYGDLYMKHYKKLVMDPNNRKSETKILNAVSEIKLPLQEAKLVFLKDNGVFEGTDTMKYTFKVIHYELGIPCRFHDFRDTHATRLIEAGADVKAVSKRLGHSNIRTTYEIYVRVTSKMESDAVERFEKIACLN